MARLPFVVEPKRKPIIERIGTEESGIIEVERRGYLTSGEKAFVQQVQQYDNGTSEIISVSRRVARQHALGLDKAYNIVLTIISGASSDNPDDEALIKQVESDFAEELTAVVKGMAAGQAREDLVYAACLLRYRVNPDFEIEDLKDIHPDIVSGLAALYRDEDAKSLQAFENARGETAEKPPAIEEIEKKPVKATASRSKSTTGA